MANTRESFKELLKKLENSVRAGWKGNHWFPHESVEGGTPTIAYGHKLTKEEFKKGKVKIGDEWVDLSEGLTEEQANALFEQDFSKHEELARKAWKPMEEKEGIKFEDLPEVSKLALAEVSFNTGKLSPSPKSWPKLKKAIAKNDKEGILREISRKNLTKRVDALRSFYKPLIEDPVHTLSPAEEKVVEAISGTIRGVYEVGSKVATSLMNFAGDFFSPEQKKTELSSAEKELIKILKRQGSEDTKPQIQKEPAQKTEKAQDTKPSGEVVFNEAYIRAQERLMLAERAAKELETLTPAEKKLVNTIKSSSSMSLEDLKDVHTANILGELMF